MSIGAFPQMVFEREAELLGRARGGDDTAFEQLMVPWQKPLLAYLYRMVAQREDADDLLQDVMLAAVQELPHHTAGSRMKTWLFGLATRRCVEHLRQQWRWRPEAHLIAGYAEDAEPEGGVVESPDSLLDARLKIVREADLEGGTSRQFHRWFFDGLTHQESGRA